MAGSQRRPLGTVRWFVVVVVATVATACSGSGGGGPATPTSASPSTASPGTSVSATTRPPSSITTLPPVPGSIPIGVIWDYAKQDEFQPYLQRLSGGTTWYELEWCQVQPDPNQPVNWARGDKNIARARAVGIEPMLRIRVGSCWATGSDKLDPGRGGLGYSVSLAPTDLGAYQAFVRSVVARYQPEGVTEYAIENEVNGDTFWRGTPDQYEALVRAGAATIRLADPHARVVDAGLSSTAWGVVIAQALLQAGNVDEAIKVYTDYYERRFDRRAQDFPRATDASELRRALDTDQSRLNRDLADITFRLAREGVVDGFQLHFYERWSNAPALMAFLRSQLPSGMPIEVWEAGLFWPGSSGDEQLIAGETARLVYLLLGNGASRVVYLPMQSNTVEAGDEIRFGLLDAQAHPRVGFEALARLADFTRQGQVTWQDVHGPAGGQSVVASGSSGAQGLVWTNGGPIPLQSSAVTITSLDGKDPAPATGVELTDDPVVATAKSATDLTALVGA